MKMSSFPKAFFASSFTRTKFWRSSSSESHLLMPLPPPPAAALSITGNLYRFASSTASSADFKGFSVPGTVGTQHSRAICFAASLSPILARTSDLGPMNLIPASSQAFAKSAFSERKPYPGCMASAPLLLASSMMPGMFRYTAKGLSFSPMR